MLHDCTYPIQSAYIHGMIDRQYGDIFLTRFSWQCGCFSGAFEGLYVIEFEVNLKWIPCSVHVKSWIGSVLIVEIKLSVDSDRFISPCNSFKPSHINKDYIDQGLLGWIEGFY